MRIKLLLTTLAIAISFGKLFAQENSLTPKQFDRYLKKPETVLIDVRTPAEWRAGKITGARLQNVQEVDSFKNALASLDTKGEYLLYCRSGKRSQRALELMKENGFVNVHDLAGGFLAWEKSKQGKAGKIQLPAHRLVLQITSGDSLAWKGLMNNLKHLQAGWGDSAQLVVVAHGAGLDLLRKEINNQQEKITQFTKMGVQFLACENTMAERKVKKEEIVKEAGFVKMGIGEIVRLQEQGWSYVKSGF
jgi:intracellular sulfur oxidation DsrE/DsrF family protein/rhodanese-related sulfurtransferase